MDADRQARRGSDLFGGHHVPAPGASRFLARLSHRGAVASSRLAGDVRCAGGLTNVAAAKGASELRTADAVRSHMIPAGDLSVRRTLLDLWIPSSGGVS